jgi:hypothetical protein
MKQRTPSEKPNSFILSPFSLFPYLVGPGISMVLHLPEAQFRELTWGREDVGEVAEDTRALTLESTRVISGDWQ